MTSPIERAPKRSVRQSAPEQRNARCRGIATQRSSRRGLPVRLVALGASPLCDAGLLLFLDLRNREPGGDRDDGNDWVRRVTWHAQRVQLFPDSNTNVGGIYTGPLFCQRVSPLVCALLVLLRLAF